MRTLVRMWNVSRGLRGTVIRALAKVGLVWAVAVLGFLFAGMSALAQHPDSYSPGSAREDARATSLSAADQAPHTAGLVLALLVLGGGVTVLAVGATRGKREPVRSYAVEPGPVPDLSLGLGLVA
jgi:hypothetical protein